MASLTVRKIAALTKPGMYADGGRCISGLPLAVQGSGFNGWRFRVSRLTAGLAASRW